MIRNDKEKIEMTEVTAISDLDIVRYITRYNDDLAEKIRTISKELTLDELCNIESDVARNLVLAEYRDFRELPLLTLEGEKLKGRDHILNCIENGYPVEIPYYLKQWLSGEKL